MEPMTIAAIAALLSGAYMQHRGQQAQIKENVQIQRRHDREADQLREEKQREILDNLQTDYTPGSYRDGLDDAQAERIAAIQALQKQGGQTQFNFSADQSDAALAEAARGEILRTENARNIARLMGNLGGHQMQAGALGRRHQTQQTRLGRFAAEHAWNEAARKRALAGNHKGAKRVLGGSLLSAIGSAMLARGGSGSAADGMIIAGDNGQMMENVSQYKPFV
ncbi:hypothetical protein [Microbulbifer sp. TYP-18]|uniref:hypothetical protein n=1 Tax=Microbulbifer sp. TYP-18 TaxID=3230024 RepID=UPI0034C5EB9F